MTVRRLGLLFSTITAAALSCVSAQAQEAETNADLRCLLVSMVMAQSSDPSSKAIGQAGSIYYLGRLDGRDPKLDLEGRLVEQATIMKPQDGQAQAMMCLSSLSARATAVGEIARNLQKRLGDAAGQTPPPAAHP